MGAIAVKRRLPLEKAGSRRLFLLEHVDEKPTAQAGRVERLRLVDVHRLAVVHGTLGVKVLCDCAGDAAKRKFLRSVTAHEVVGGDLFLHGRLFPAEGHRVLAAGMKMAT